MDKWTLETRRLTLIPFTSEYAELFRQINTEEKVRQTLWYGENMSLTRAEEMLMQSEACFDDMNWGLWQIVLKETRDVVGYAGLWPFMVDIQPQLVCALFPESTKQGYALEALKRVISYAYENLQYNSIMMFCLKENKEAHSLALRAGLNLQYEKVIDKKALVFFQQFNCNKLAYFSPSQDEEKQILTMMEKRYRQGKNFFNYPEKKKILQTLMKDPARGRVWIITFDEKTIGYAVLTTSFSFRYGGTVAFIDELYLEEYYLWGGIGGEVLKFLENQAIEMNTKTMLLEVEENNLRERSLFFKSGFDSHDKRLMTKPLKE